MRRPQLNLLNTTLLHGPTPAQRAEDKAVDSSTSGAEAATQSTEYNPPPQATPAQRAEDKAVDSSTSDAEAATQSTEYNPPPRAKPARRADEFYDNIFNRTSDEDDTL